MRHADDCRRVLAGDEDDWRVECDCSHAAMRARQRELERALRLVLASASPHPDHHPTMHAAWLHAQEVLEGKR